MFAERGFALPTVLISSIVMMIVLLVAISGGTSIRAALSAQYLDQLKREAGESGLAMAKACLLESGTNTPTWSDTNPLMPNTDCDGNAEACSGLDDPKCAVLVNDTVRTSFRVGDATLVNGLIHLNAEASVQQLASGGTTAWKTHDGTRKGTIGLGVNYAEFVASGFLQVCAIFDGQTWCWGSNEQGQLGIGTAGAEPEETSPGVPNPLHDPAPNALHLTPEKVHRLSGGLEGKKDKIVQVGDSTMCIVTTDDDIYCTGKNNHGQLGNGESGSGNRRLVMTQVQKPAGMQGKEVTKMASSRNTMCALAEGDVWCWGNDTYGQLGNGGGYSSVSTPVRIHNSLIGTTSSPARPVTDLAGPVAGLHTCAVAASRAYCWGYNGRGEVGDNTTNNRASPVAVNTSASSSLQNKTVTRVVAEGRYPVTIVDTEFPSNPPNGNQARSGHSCALAEGAVHCWGADQYGQAGQGSVPSSPWRRGYPVRVTAGGMNGRTVTDISAGTWSTCALVASEDGGKGMEYCWGRNTGGQLGRGAIDNNSYPTPAAIAKNHANSALKDQTIATISGGANRHCVLTNHGKTYCWGINNSAGQLGDGTRNDSGYPVEATMLQRQQPLAIY